MLIRKMLAGNFYFKIMKRFKILVLYAKLRENNHKEETRINLGKYNLMSSNNQNKDGNDDIN